MATTQTAYSLRQIDGGINYFSQFSHSLPTDPNFFPVGAWLEAVHTQQDINLDKAAGFNIYIGITANSNFSLVEQNGMYVIAQQDELRTNNTINNNSSTVGWIVYDEIDMVLGPGGFSTQQNIIASLPNDDRFIYNNYGKGVQFWQSTADAARYVNSVDVLSADLYWFTDPNIDGGSEGGDLLNNGNPLTLTQTRLAANYGYSIDHLRALDATDGVPHPIWGVVELGWPFTETAAQGGRAIAPAEVKAAVWHQIIAGARGIIYFNHSFGGPEDTQNVLRDPAYAGIAAAVTQTDALIKQLAPVINSPFDDAFVTVNSSVRAMAKYYNGEHYVFAGATVNGAAAGTDSFTLAGITNGTAEVIGENRTIPIVDGQFADTFADGNAIHIYHIIANGTQTPTPGSVSITDVTISEGNSGTKVATFTVTRSGGTAAFDVNYATSNGTATVADSDYVAASNTLHFGANQNTQTFSVTINGDTKVEGNETFNVNLAGATNGATISDDQGIGTITNDDGAAIAGSVSINDVSISEGNSGTKVATFTVTRSGGTAAFDVNYATSNGTATVADSDYVAASNTLHFGANQNTQTFSVTINGDTKVEGNETFNVNLAGATNGATISDDQGIGTITNDDGAAIAGSVSINDVSISEGNSGTKVATFTVTRSGGTAAFDVNYATSNGTATVADIDYVAASNTLHFGANQNTQTFSVTINGDTKVEGNETFNVNLAGATNGATISDDQGIGTITNDDGAGTPNLVVNGGFESGNFSGWTLSGNSGGNQIYIAPTAFPGGVHSGSYSAGLGSMNRTDGILTQSIATTAGQHYTLSFWIQSDNDGFTPINHFAAEWNGQTLMAATDAPNSGYQLYTYDVVGINGNSVLEFSGYNDPDAWRLDDVTLTAAGVAPPAVAGSVSITDVTISEGNSGTKVATFMVTRSGGTAAFDVNYATSNGTATVADSDYVAASNTLHFGANQNTQTFSVTINGDTKVEGNETFNVNLAGATNGATISDDQGIGTITNDDGAGTPNLVVNGDSGANVLNGGAGNDTVNGGSGNDWLNGGLGNDMLTGGPGYDTFFFNAPLNAANVDQVADFYAPRDTFQLDDAVFSALTTGTLARGAFYEGARAHDASDRIIYDSTTGALSYDADGNTVDGVAAVQFATLNTGLNLARGDFVVV